jgi:hypothetical protein
MSAWSFQNNDFSENSPAILSGHPANVHENSPAL